MKNKFSLNYFIGIKYEGIKIKFMRFFFFYSNIETENWLPNKRIQILTLHSLLMTFKATSWTLAEANATAVSAMISDWPDPRPPVTLLWKKIFE